MVVSHNLVNRPGSPVSSVSTNFGILAVVYGSIITVMLFNKFIMGPFMHMITHFEKHPTTDKAEYSFTIKYTIGLFFTTALMTLIV